MTVTAIPGTAATNRPPRDAGDCGDHRNPAPLATMLAVLGRIASHAGGPLVLTVTEPGQTIHVAVATAEQYRAWVREIAADGQAVRGTHVPFEAMTCLHGWSTTILRRPGR